MVFLLLVLGIASLAVAALFILFILYVTLSHSRMIKKLREDGFYD